MQVQRGYTNVKKHVILYQWQINEISSYIEKCDDNTDQNIFLESPRFAAGSSLEKRWNLELKSSPKDVQSVDKKWLSIFLMLSTESSVEAKTKYLCFILNHKNERIKVKKFSKTFTGVGGWGNRKFLETNELLEKKDELVPNNTLTIGIELTVFDSFTTISNSLAALTSNHASLADDFKNLLDSKIGSDVVLSVKDQLFNAHRSILMARSPVFSTMFSLEMKERKEDRVSITDIDPEIFKSLLEFIYTDDVSNLEAIAEDLLEVADRYMVDSLKARCAETLCQSLTVDNAVKLLMLAERYNVKEMLDLVSEFILTNAKSVIETPDYSVMEKSNPSLGLVLLKKFAHFNSDPAT
ncbi:GSCOCG00001404001-RA-CDS [Cotesia congregata]|uniref:Similar to spop: Speckle-type POZ protein (Xenopus tropicalis) n=1 Tax=Cotesia congregata TaxID=51543 RepID=A0A8J2EDT9_COTCN|nr:GSCOCG00001404001-RA-CDS [Cotesia congregata]CAG5076611.1 Similar to spop: Speckle-type POZ protein (Xenopus tropicalis) [Cotesia congregata]